MILKHNHVKLTFLLAASFVLVVCNNVGAQSEKRELQLDLGLIEGSIGTIYEPSKEVFEQEAVKQQEVQMCLPECSATKEVFSRWKVGPYSQERKYGKDYSHDLLQHGKVWVP